MRCGIASVSLVVCFAHLAALNVEFVMDPSTEWGAPPSVARCPLHKNFEITPVAGNGVYLKPPGHGKFSVAQKELPAAAKISASTGLIIRYTSPPGAPGVSLWRIRVTDSTQRKPYIRFTHLFSIPADGVVNETRYMPWKDFRGQILQPRSTKVIDCLPQSTDPQCTLKPESITHVSFLESEDTVAHEIVLHSLVVTTDPIEEQHPIQHHTEEAAALIWEREHHAQNIHEFDYNGTHYVVGGNCTETVCKTPSKTTPSHDQHHQHHHPTTPPKSQGDGVIMQGVAGATTATLHLFWAAAFAAICFTIRA